ncbi:MAG TPA: acetolactate synthase small subunit [Candidatus Faecivivens stercoripullorum]|uniref:Acetolactate synthase small subunit n=1 Tax=Candidatus Faecivivens stercoripullorum TaxID=2840805 RepID=A0A9D1H8Y1_9FIRM|nr:acetolactate synthase small subunit [Candidatus Faecivivens stercoripullorum]
MEKDILVKVTAHNCPGLLQRVCALFSRRFFNIQSIVAAQNLNPEVSQIFIVVRGDNRIARQVEKQLDKLYDVVSVEILDADKVILREHLMIKVKKDEASGAQLIAIANAFHASVLQVGKDAMALELSGDVRQLNSFVEMLKPFGVLEMIRTGAMAMTVS